MVLNYGTGDCDENNNSLIDDSSYNTEDDGNS